MAISNKNLTCELEWESFFAPGRRKIAQKIPVGRVASTHTLESVQEYEVPPFSGVRRFMMQPRGKGTLEGRYGGMR
jgi:hypothetical protein